MRRVSAHYHVSCHVTLGLNQHGGAITNKKGGVAKTTGAEAGYAVLCQATRGSSQGHGIGERIAESREQREGSSQGRKGHSG